MRVILAGGGTAGHINPALAIGATIKKHHPEAELLYIGAKGGMEETLVQKAGICFVGIEISGFKRSVSLSAMKKNLSTVKKAYLATRESKKIIKNFNPTICIGTGGYVSGPVIKAAAKLGYPTVIHEQNAFPGITTKLLSSKVDKVMLAVADASKHIKKANGMVLTGNPVKSEILSVTKEEGRKHLKITDDKPVILSFGGSLGARRVNESTAALIAKSAKDGKYRHIHACGKSNGGLDGFVNHVKENYGVDITNCNNIDAREFIYDMPYCLAASDIAISRAGAISLSEIQAQGKPAVLIPSPNVAENHQYHNAMALVNAGAAAIIEEKDLTGDKLIETVENILSDENKLKKYSQNAAKTAIIDANERIYKVICEVLKAKQ